MLNPCSFCSQIKHSHAYFLVLEKSTDFNFFKEKGYISCVKAKISPKDKGKLNFGQIFQLYKVNHAYFLRGNDLAMLFFGQIYSSHAYFFLKSILAMLSPCLFFIKSYLSHAYKLHAYKKKNMYAIVVSKSNNTIHTPLNLVQKTGTRKFSLADLGCRGNEKTLAECSHIKDPTYCNVHEGVFLVCIPN